MRLTENWQRRAWCGCIRLANSLPCLCFFVACVLCSAGPHSVKLFADELRLGFPVTEFTPAFLPQEVLAVGGHDIAILNASSLKVISQISLPEISIASARAIESVDMPSAILVGGRIDGQDGYLGLYSLGNATPIWEIKDLESPIVSVCTVGARGFVGDDVGNVLAFDMRNGQPAWAAALHAKMVTAMVPISDRHCVSGDWVGKLVVFDVETGGEQFNFQQHRDRITGLAADTKSTPVRLYSASRDGTFRLWYPAQRRLVRFVQLEQAVTAFASLGEQQFLLATRNVGSKVWLHRADMEIAKIAAEQQTDEGFLQAHWLTPSGSILASDGHEKVFHLPETVAETVSAF